MHGYQTLVAGNLLMTAALATTSMRGWGRRKVAQTVGLVFLGVLMLLQGEDPAVMVCAVSLLAAGAMLLAEMTAARRGVLSLAWIMGGLVLIGLNLRYEAAGKWIAEMKPWVTVSAFALIVSLAGAAVGTARLARDPDFSPGGV